MLGDVLNGVPGNLVQWVDNVRRVVDAAEQCDEVLVTIGDRSWVLPRQRISLRRTVLVKAQSHTISFRLGGPYHMLEDLVFTEGGLQEACWTSPEAFHLVAANGLRVCISFMASKAVPPVPAT